LRHNQKLKVLGVYNGAYDLGLKLKIWIARSEIR
jgi:hypothetical protein